MKVYAAVVEYYNEFEKTMKTEYLFTLGTSFADAAKQLDDYYGSDLESVKLDYYDSSVIVCPNKETYDGICDNFI